MSKQVTFKLSNPVHFLALGFGSGLLKPAPGTWGTLAAIPLYILVALSLQLSLPAYSALLVLTFILGVYVCGKTADDVGVHDHGAIVWDEVVGYLVTMLAITPSMLNIVLGFILFRVFDILKPWPIKALDRSVQGGFGIMIDDVIAGLLACAVLHVSQPWIADIV
ncbi:MAG: phosphatidylglycerophosphatase A [Pseudomonadota bacterium]